MKKLHATALFLLFSTFISAQITTWRKDGNAFWQFENKQIVEYSLPDFKAKTIADSSLLVPAGKRKGLRILWLKASDDNSKLLFFTNSKRVWRYDTRGDYWVLDLKTKQLRQIGVGFPESSLMFAKFSPDGQKVAYVSRHNIYVEGLADGKIQQMTTDGTDKIINGTFDWAYEEELDCRDGFRWSPDSKKIAYWQIDASAVKYFLMINNTDSIYPFTVPVEYPKVGEAPSAARIGVISVENGVYTEGSFRDLKIRKGIEKDEVAPLNNANSKLNKNEAVNNAKPSDAALNGAKNKGFNAELISAILTISANTTQWLNIEGEPNQHYLPSMDWANSSEEIIVQQLNRKQNFSKIWLGNATNGAAKIIYQESDAAWIDTKSNFKSFDESDDKWTWINGGKEFIWLSEKDGWRHYYKVSKDGKKETLLTKGNYDVISECLIDVASNSLYFIASPDNATEKYLYKTTLDGKGNAERLSPLAQIGTHKYTFSPNGKWARHTFSNTETLELEEWLAMPKNKAIDEKISVKTQMEELPPTEKTTEFFQITTEDGVKMDGWVVKPANFDSTLKYPIVFNVYTEPAATTVTNEFGVSQNYLYNGDMSTDGYIYVSLDGRGTPAPKGRDWRKAIYRKVGLVNIRDQAMAAKALFKQWAYVDTSRVAVWGWSGGGSATLNLLFQYPEIYKTGIAVAAVADQLCYDNIYQERYMGIPQENREDFVAGSPITYAKNLQGNLLYIHGTGDDNVHFQNAERLVNELVKYNKQFQYMAYPNRTHGIYEGEGTTTHLVNLFTNYLRANCPSGPRSAQKP
jgi:dipeptidyl-peptidase 4